MAQPASRLRGLVDHRQSRRSSPSQRGKVLLIVNTASQCGFTPQFAASSAVEGLPRPRPRGDRLSGANQFGGQDPGGNDQIPSFCEMNYGVSFPMMARSR